MSSSILGSLVIGYGVTEVNLAANKSSMTHLLRHQKIYYYSLAVIMVAKKELIFRVYPNKIVQAGA